MEKVDINSIIKDGRVIPYFHVFVENEGGIDFYHMCRICKVAFEPDTGKSYSPTKHGETLYQHTLSHEEVVAYCQLAGLELSPTACINKDKQKGQMSWQ